MKSLYLLINFFTIIIPLIFSFHPKIQFHKTWKAFFKASALIAVIFIFWDSIFTQLGVWFFNSDYIIGLYVFKLPIEEILFFFCIPFSCVFTYFCLDKFYNLTWNKHFETVICLLFSVILLMAGFVYFDRIYTSITFISTAMICLFLKFVAKVDWFGKAFFVYLILLVPFFIVNGILTGTGIEKPVVSYNDAENMGVRLLTIPVEDAFYGFELILLNLFLYKRFLNED